MAPRHPPATLPGGFVALGCVLFVVAAGAASAVGGPASSLSAALAHVPGVTVSAVPALLIRVGLAGVAVLAFCAAGFAVMSVCAQFASNRDVPPAVRGGLAIAGGVSLATADALWRVRPWVYRASLAFAACVLVLPPLLGFDAWMRYGDA